jgi:hypothetical protein
MEIRSALNTVLASPAFQRLEERVRDVTIFEILGIAGRELSHAAFLAWLLRPDGTHGSGSASLRRFLLLATSLLDDGPRGISSPRVLDAADVDDLSLDSLLVETEVPIDGGARRFDILVSHPPEKPGDLRGAPVLIIEYKVDAMEGKDQTADYAAWATRHPSSTGVLPLQVFLCPPAYRGPAPSPPFVTLDFDACLLWLDAITSFEHSERAQFLIREFRACLTRRADVTDWEQDDLVDRLRSDAATHNAVAFLRAANDQVLSPYRSVIERHSDAFSALDVTLSRPQSLGDSATIVRVRNAIRGALDNGRWAVSEGKGSLTARFVGAGQVLRSHGLKLQFWMERPMAERGALALEFSGKSDAALKASLAESLRNRISCVLPGTRSRRGGTVVRVGVTMRGVHDIGDDDLLRADSNEDAIRYLVEVVTNAAPVIDAWARDELPTLISKTEQQT